MDADVPAANGLVANERLRVLVVEDRPSDAELMELRLEDEGFDAQIVRVETEPEYLAQLDARPDLILSDWRLPAFSGLRALLVVRERGEDTPFVIVSGRIGEEAAVDAMRHGADDYVFKDRLARLGPAVRRALEAKRLRDEHERADAYLRQAAMVFESNSEGIMVTDVDGAIVAVNRAFTEVTGYAEAEALGQNPRILRSGQHGAAFFRDLWISVRTTGRWQGEIWNRRRNGEVFPAWLVISAVTDDGGRTTNYAGILRDLGEVKAAQDQLAFVAQHDVLTGLPNRTLLDDRLAQALAHADRTAEAVAVVELDIDRFGKVNEGLGPAVGDGLLAAVARRLTGEIPAGDTLARLASDKFVIVLVNGGSTARLARLVRGYQDSVAVPFDIEGHEVIVTCSAGISRFPIDGTDGAALLRLSDAALRRARALGGNTMAFVDPADVEVLQGRLEFERLLRGAIGRHELVVHYQPQVDLSDRSLVGVEALVRWQLPGRGLVPPGEFISIAEEIGIIDEIGTWVLAESCRQVAAWEAGGFVVPRIAVNLSAQQLERAGLVTSVSAALDAAALAPERLELEVTESMIMHHAGAAALILADLRAVGVELAMDDFGTGHSSLAQLRHLPVGTLKIDISFVRDIGRDAAAEAIIRAIIAIARSLELRTVAEGVEQEDQAAFLRDAGCDIGQGYLFGRPVPADALAEAWR